MTNIRERIKDNDMNEIVNIIIKDEKLPFFFTHKNFEEKGLKKEEFEKNMEEGINGGYIDKVYNDIYAVNMNYNDKVIPMGVLAQMIDPDSYVSMNHVLCEYSWIPEMIYSVTSVTTRESRTVYVGNYGKYMYRNIYNKKQDAGIINEEDFEGYYKSAKPLRALCDVLEFRKDPIYDSEGLYDVLRIHKSSLLEDLNGKDFDELQGAFEDKYIEEFLNNLRKELNL